MAKTKQIFPTMSKTPQDSGSSFLPILYVSAGLLQVFTQSPKKYPFLQESQFKGFYKTIH
jgi:hypothetical protein